MNLTAVQIRAVLPVCRDSNLWASILPKVADEFEINDTDRFAAFLAQISEESGQLNQLREGMSYSMLGLMKTWPTHFPTEDSAKPFVRDPTKLANFIYANREGNGNFASGDGFRYRGGGLIQITFRDNYREMGELIGVPLEAQPAKIEDKLIAARAAGAFWKKNGCNELADARDFEGITKRINGGLNGLDARKLYMVKWLAVLGHAAAAA